MCASSSSLRQHARYVCRLADGSASAQDLQSLLARATAAAQPDTPQPSGISDVPEAAVLPCTQPGVSQPSAFADNDLHSDAASPAGATLASTAESAADAQHADSPAQQAAGDADAAAHSSRREGEQAADDDDSRSLGHEAMGNEAAGTVQSAGDAAYMQNAAPTVSKLQTQLSAFKRSLSRNGRAAATPESVAQSPSDAASAPLPGRITSSASPAKQRNVSPWRWFKKSKALVARPQQSSEQQQESALVQLISDLQADSGAAQLAVGQLVWVSLDDAWVVSTIARMPRGPGAALFAVDKIERKRVSPLLREQLVPATSAKKGIKVVKDTLSTSELPSQQPELLAALLRNDVQSEVKEGAGVWMQLQRWEAGEVVSVHGGGGRAKAQHLLHEVRIAAGSVTVQRERLLPDCRVDPLDGAGAAAEPDAAAMRSCSGCYR